MICIVKKNGDYLPKFLQPKKNHILLLPLFTIYYNT